MQAVGDSANSNVSVSLAITHSTIHALENARNYRPRGQTTGTRAQQSQGPEPSQATEMEPSAQQSPDAQQSHAISDTKRERHRYHFRSIGAGFFCI
jgi:hypothetical protein